MLHLLHLTTARQLIWTACMFAVAGFAQWRGGWAERTIAWAMVLDSYGAIVLQNTHNWAAVQWSDLWMDSLYLALMLWVALKSNRLWTLWAAAFQLVDVCIYLAHSANLRVGGRAPNAAILIYSYLILIVIAVGTWQHRHDRPANRPSPSPST